MYPRYNIYQNGNYMQNIRGNDDRFIGGGFFAPLLLGGLAGYAIGRPNYPTGPYPYNNFYYNNVYYPYPTFYYR